MSNAYDILQRNQKKNQPFNINKNEDLKSQSRKKKNNLRKNNESATAEVDKIKDFLKKDSFKQIEPKQKEDFSDKLKEELNQLKQLTKEADNIFTEKKEKGNEKTTENEVKQDNSKKQSNEFKSKKEGNSNKISHGNKNSSQEAVLFDQEFEEKLSYLIDKLDIINRITK